MTFRTISGKACTALQPSRKNLIPNPAFRTVGSSTEIRRNTSTNPSFRATSGTVEVRRNLAPNPSVASSFAWPATRWFGNGSGVGTYSVETGAGAVGNGFRRKTWNGTTQPTSNGDTGFECRASNGTGTIANYGWACTAGEVYSVSGYMRTSATNKGFCVRVDFMDAAGVRVGSPLPNTTPTVTNPAVDTWFRLSATVTVPTNAVWFVVYLDCVPSSGNTIWALGDTLDADGLLVEKVGAVLPYFDGAATAADGLTYSWTGTADASPAIATGTAVSAWSANVNMKIWQGADGASMRALAIGAGANCYQASYLPAGVGETWSHGLLVSSDTNGAIAKLGNFSYPSTGSALDTLYAPDVTFTTGSTRMTVTSNATPSGTAGVRSIFLTNSVGNIFTLRQSLVEQSSVSLPYFDGTTASADGLTYSWTGTANASASIASGTNNKNAMYGYANIKSWIISGAAWDGSNVATCYPATGSNALVLLEGDYDNAIPGTYVAGRLCARAVVASGTRTINVNSQSYTSGSGLVSPTTSVSNVSLPANQWVDITLVSTVPVDARADNVRFLVYRGTGWAADDRLEISHRLFEQVSGTGIGPGDYFDGSSRQDGTGAAYQWDGVVDNSFSSYYPVRSHSMLDIDGVTWRSHQPIVGRKNYLTNPAFRATSGTQEARRNLCTNPSAEVAAVGWSSNNGAYWTSSNDTTVYRTQGASRLSTVTSTPSGLSLLSFYAIGHDFGTRVPVTAGKTYTLSVYLRSGVNVATQGRVGIMWNDSAKANIGSTVYGTWTATAYNAWTRVSLTATAPANAAYCYLNADLAKVSGAAAAGEQAWADDALFEEAASARPYFDGSTAADSLLTYSWTGTANASQAIATGKALTDWNGSTPSRVQGPAVGAGYSMDMRNSPVNYTSILPGQKVGDYWSAKVTVQSIPGETPSGAMFYARMHDGNGYTSDYPGQLAVPADGSSVTFVTTASLPTTRAAARLYVYAVSSAPLRVTEALVEKVSGPGIAVGEYFDGSSPTGRKNLCRNPAVNSTIGGYQGLTGNAYVVAPWDTSRSAYRAQGNGSTTAYVFSCTAIGPFRTGETVTVSGTVQVEAGKWYRTYVHARTGNDYFPTTGVGSTNLTQSDGNPTRVSRTFTLTKDIPDCDFAMLVYDSVQGGVLTAGSTFFLSDVVVERSSNASPYFDGNTLSANEKTYGWLGTPNNSISYETDVNYTYSWSGVVDASPSIQSP